MRSMTLGAVMSYEQDHLGVTSGAVEPVDLERAFEQALPGGAARRQR